jgi:hypothetical protein
MLAPRRCAKCKEVTPHAYLNLEDYVEIRCEVCEQPAKRISHEKIWERLGAALLYDLGEVDDDVREADPDQTRGA